MKLLLIDAGNTRTKWAVSASSAARFTGLGEMATADVTRARILALGRGHPGAAIALACVVPRLMPLFRSAFGSRLCVVSGSRPDLDLKFDYPNPSEVGADRLAAAVAVHARGNFPAIIVQCGTATAYTVLNAQGAFSGGAIAPGLEAQARGLLGSTAQLPAVALRSGKMRTAIARNTRDAIRAGLLLSFQGGIRETLQRLQRDLASRRPVTIFISGGAADLVPDFDGARREPLLVFEGLRIIGHRVFAGHE